MPKQVVVLEESLTKENFWNDIEVKYPNAFRVFINWIDAYKKAVNWDKLFNFLTSDTDIKKIKGRYPTISKIALSPKFHDLPYAFQLGMWFEFIVYRGGCQYLIEDIFDFNLKEDINIYMQGMETDFKLET